MCPIFSRYCKCYKEFYYQCSLLNLAELNNAVINLVWHTGERAFIFTASSIILRYKANLFFLLDFKEASSK